MTLLYRIIPAHIYISLCAASWGIFASLQSIAGSFVSVFILRALLRVGEAAFSPGVPFLLLFFSKRVELALRTGLFISAAPLATSFAGSLAWLIMKAGERVPIAAWRLFFLIEGSPAIIMAVVTLYQIPDSPEMAKYLSRREKIIAQFRLRGKENSEEMMVTEKSRLNWQQIGQALRDPKCWITAISLYMGFN